MIKFYSNLKIIKKFFSVSSLLDYIFYRKCYFCSKKARINIICDKCRKKILGLGCRKTRIIQGITIEGYYFYKDEILKLIRGVKYHNKKLLAREIADILVKIAGKEKFKPDDIEIAPVPMHYERLKKRKYNHMEILANEISKITSCDVNTGLIKRIKNTRPQYKLNSKERRKNLKGAFSVNKEFYSGKNLVLFDDISTTGATMEILITELKKNGIKDITGFVIAFA